MPMLFAPAPDHVTDVELLPDVDVEVARRPDGSVVVTFVEDGGRAVADAEAAGQGWWWIAVVDGAEALAGLCEREPVLLDVRGREVARVDRARGLDDPVLRHLDGDGRLRLVPRGSLLASVTRLTRRRLALFGPAPALRVEHDATLPASVVVFVSLVLLSAHVDEVEGIDATGRRALAQALLVDDVVDLLFFS